MQRTWAQSAGAYLRPRSLAMLGLGFSAGLPFLLVFSTLTAWLSDAGVARAAIGAFGWIGTTYSIKVVWAPLVDRLPLPLLDRQLGRRRSWMLVGQLGIVAGLLAMSRLDPATQLPLVAAVALFVAFSSATQDVAVDAWRVEAEEAALQGVMAAAYVGGYRVAMLAAGAGALWLAELRSWPMAYAVMAGLGGVGIVTTLLAPEPAAVDPAPLQGSTRRDRLRSWAAGAVVAPLSAFARQHAGRLALTLALVALFKVPDIVMAGMANPFLLETGYSKGEIAALAKVVGFGATLGGAALGGVLVARWGGRRALLPGVLGLAASNLAFAALAAHGAADPAGLAGVVLVDNLAGGFASAVFVAWLSSLTTPGFSATQYALLSSIMTLPAKLASGFSGAAVDALGWPAFFVLTAAMGLPALSVALRFARAEGPQP